MARDEGRERLWLARAERAAGASEFAGRAALRLALGDLAYGHRWAELGLDRLITEVAEEAADLGAWGVLALQALERDPGIPAAAAAAIAARLHAAILAGARAHRELERARTELHRSSAAGARRRFTPDVDGRCVNCDRSYSAHADLCCPPMLKRPGSRTGRP